MGNYAEERKTLYREPENLQRKGYIQLESRGINEHILKGSKLGKVFQDVESPAVSTQKCARAQSVWKIMTCRRHGKWSVGTEMQNDTQR